MITEMNYSRKNRDSLIKKRLSRLFIPHNYRHLLLLPTFSSFSVFFIFLFFICTFYQSSAQPYWALAAGSTLMDEGTDVAVDANGNTYATGYFSGTASFGSVSLTSFGVTDIFVVKLNTSGTVQWAVKAGGPGADRGLSIKVDAQGNSYVTGYFNGTAKFDAISMTSLGAQDIFIAKYNTSGVLQWVKQAGGPANDIGNGIAVDNSGNVLITGQFSDTAKFDNTTLISQINPTTQIPSLDVFIAKYDGSGNLQWVKKGSAPYTDRGIDVACDPNGNIYVTGQFTDTITFDAVHNNNMYNAIFLIKINSSGAEQWFTKIAGGSMNMVYGIAVDKNANVYLTGDFLGNLIFFGASNYTLTNAYTNRIFVAKYNTSGTLVWAKSNGSVSEISVRNIALDNDANVYIVGNFLCKFSEYADKYGQGTFNSIGYHDVFVTKFNTSGTWQWSRHFGGQSEDYGAGIALNTGGEVFTTGSFYSRMVFATTSTINGTYYNSYGPNTGATYCSDGNYGTFSNLNGIGSADIFVAKAIDLSREPYDYYKRSGTACDRPYLGVCVIANNTSTETDCGGDSLTVCGSATLSAISKTADASWHRGYVGPNFSYLWSSGQTARDISVIQTGKYSVQLSTQDGCFVSNDTMYVTVNPFPDKPTISDSKGVNTNSLNPQKIVFCTPDSVKITAGNQGTGTTYSWSGGQIDSKDPLSIWVKQSGVYTFTTTNKYGCSTSNAVQVVVNTKNNLPTPDPRIILLNDPDKNDSVSFCVGGYFTILVYDTITNPNATLTNIPYSITDWTITPSAAMSWNHDPRSYDNFYPTHTDTYVVNATLTVQPNNTCGGSTTVYHLTKTVYAEVLPKSPPLSVTISGTTTICPGETNTLTANVTGATSYQWYGSGIVGASNQNTVTVSQPGWYSVNASGAGNGCGTSTGSANIYLSNPTTNPTPPTVTMNPSNGLICPNDSVLLTAQGGLNYEWHGPSGVIGGNTTSIKASTPGYYYVISEKTTTCKTSTDTVKIASNTVELKQYGTPYLYATPSTLLCVGDKITLNVVTNDGSTLQWQPPLSGGSLTQVVTAAGTYTCIVTSCGIKTTVSVKITSASASAKITPEGPLDFCPGGFVILDANVGMADYEWTPGKYHSPKDTVYQSGTYTVKTTDGNGCTAISPPVTVTVHPIFPPVTADKSICSGYSAGLTATSSYGTIKWFNVFSGGTSIATGKNYTTPVLTSPVTYYVQNEDSVCKSTRVSATVNIKPTSLKPTINTNSPFCEGNTLILSDTTIIPNAIYSWTGPKGITSNKSTLMIPNITAAYSGNYTLTVSGDGCTSPSAQVAVTVYPIPPTPVMNNNSPICEGVTLYLTSSPITNATYSWTGPDSFASALQNPSIENSTLANTGTYFLTATVNDCKSQTATTTVTIKQTPTPNPQSNSPLCEGETLNLTIDTVLGAVYRWTGPASFSSSFPDPVIQNTTTRNSGEYAVFGTLENCISAVKKTAVQINPIPIIHLGNDTIICLNSSITLRASKAVDYLWQDNSFNDSYTVSKEGTYYVKATTDSGCIATDTVKVKVKDCTFCVPTIITPNEDGANDNFSPCSTIGLQSLWGRIYNRWGTLIYEWKNMDAGWDGTIQPSGRKASNGVYYYIIQTTDYKNAVEEHTGFVELMKQQ